jgi:hypothetical protein
MVQAILNTKPGVWPAEPVDPEKPYKWQTRRVIKPQPQRVKIEIHSHKSTVVLIDDGKKMAKRPYREGDIFYLRETWGGVRVGLAGDRNFAHIEYECGEGKTIDINKEQAKPSIHMPREAARLFLEVKNIRIGKLQDMGVADAIAEGTGDFGCDSVDWFADYWDSLNAKRGYSWDNNPWVWVIEFMRVEK